MRRFSSLMSLLAVAAMMFVACSEKNPTPDSGDLTFKVSVNSSDKSSVTFSVEPSDKSIDYVVYACQNSVALGYDTDEELVAALGEEVSFADYTYRGDITDVISGLKINTGYSLLVFTQQNNTLTSKLHKSSFRTAAVMYIDCTFTFEPTVEDTKVTLLIEPSNREVEWYHCVMPQKEYIDLTNKQGAGKSPEEVVAENYAAKAAELMAGGKSAEEVRAELVKTSNRKMVHENLQPTTEYICLAAAVEFDDDELYVNSEVSNATFTTGDVPVEEGQYTMTATNVGAYGFTLNIEATSENLYYYPAIAFPDSYDEAALISQIHAAFNEQYQLMLIKYKDNPSMVTNELVLEESPIFFSGSLSFGVSNIPPQTEVMGVVFVMRSSTGLVGKVQRFDNLATTVEPCNINPTIEVAGIFSGDEEAGEILGNAGATAGRAIIVGKTSNFEGASEVYSVFGTQGSLDAASYPDWRVVWFFGGYWVTLNLDEPYSFHVGNWDEAAFLYAYAKDANGVEGGVARCSVTPSVLDTGTMEELQEYYDKAMGTDATAAPMSLVIK